VLVDVGMGVEVDVGVRVGVVAGALVAVLVGVTVGVLVSVSLSVEGGERGAPMATGFADALTDWEAYAIAVRKATRAIPSRMQTLLMGTV